MMNKQDREDLKFILEVMENLEVDPDSWSWGVSFEQAKREKELAEIKLRRMIREDKIKKGSL